MKTFTQPLQPFKTAVPGEYLKPTPPPILLQCIYGNHDADLLHRGTAYCRSCYDSKNLTGTLIN